MKSSVADVLVSLAEETFELFHDSAGEEWAYDRTSHDTLRIGSSSFADRLVRDFYIWSARSRSVGRIPSPTAITQVVQALRGIARFDGPQIPVFVRIGKTQDGTIVLDLADAEGRGVTISPSAWELTEDPPVRFWRPEGMHLLPVPVGGGCLDELLAEALHVTDQTSLVLLEGWLLGCLNPTGSKAVLMLLGEQGSGKSWLARMLRCILDPNIVPLRTMPQDERDLVIMARQSAVLGFDNVSMFTEEQSDALCRVATGGGFSTRRLYTDSDEVQFQATRPALVTSIVEVDRQSDLADRSLHVTCDRIGDAERRTEEDLHAAFTESHPTILGALLDGVACALANLAQTDLPELPRMADLALFVTAAEPALGHTPGTFVEAYRRNRDEAAEGAIEGTAVGRYLIDVAQEGFAGTATQLLDRIERKAGTDQPRRRGWPMSPRGLAGIVRRLAPALRTSGYSVEFERVPDRSRQRIIRLTFLGHEGPPAKVLDGDPDKADSSVEQVAAVMVAGGLDETWEPVRTATRARDEASGDSFLAAQALNLLKIPAPDGGTWTAWKVHGVT
jgi:hypothetical protein